MSLTETTIKTKKTTQSRLQECDFENLGFGKLFSDHMFVSEYADGQWGHFKIEPFGPILMSPAMSALHYGQAIFEGLKAHKNSAGDITIFRPEKNAQRLNKTAARMCMPDFPEEIFVEAVKQLVVLDKDWIPTKDGEALYIRPVMFATDALVGVKASETYLLIIFTSPVGRYYSGQLKVKIENKYTRASKGGTGQAKTAGNYAASLLPATLAKEAGYDQVLWTDGLTHEYFEESGTMNVMFCSGNKIFTPQLSDSILDGITRDSVLTLARDWGYDLEERKVSVAEVIDLLKAGNLSEAFGVGTAATVAPIASIAYQGTDYQLPPYEQWKFAPRARKHLDLLKHGLVEDVHGWNVWVK